MNRLDLLMKPFSAIRLGILSLLCFTFFACEKKTTEEFETALMSDYLPLEVGKYITYRLDSLVFVRFQQDIEIHSYLVKHVVDAKITDNLGRPSYRIFRYLNNTAGTNPWEPNGSYLVSIADKQIEQIEDNRRVVKLHAPVNEDYAWKGNMYLPEDPYKDYGYNFQNDNTIQKWEFFYDSFAPAFSYAGKNYQDICTVVQEMDSVNVPIVLPAYAYKNYLVDKYAKNVGLVYREHTMWEYQPNLTGPHPTYTGFGVKMWMVDHN